MNEIAYPNGTALLFHGLTGTIEEMTPLAKNLEQNGYRAVVPNLPGHDNTIASLRKVTAQDWLHYAKTNVQNLYVTYGRPLAVIGLSMGSLLALHCAATFPNYVSSVVVLSPPVRLKKAIEDTLLAALSYLPETLVQLIPGVSPKAKRPPECLALPHPTLDGFPICSAVRFAKVRRIVLSSLNTISSPVLLGYDPNDHLISSAGIEELKKLLSSAQVEERAFPGGQHELTLGHSYQEVYKAITNFLDSEST